MLAAVLSVIAILGATTFVYRTVRSVRSAPQHLRSMALGFLSISLALFALGCSTLMFVPPRTCGSLMLLTSISGVWLAAMGFRQCVQLKMTWPSVVGLLANTCTLIFGLTLLPVGVRHPIDRWEHTSRTLLETVNCSAFAAILLVLAVRVGIWFSERKRRESGVQFSLAALLLTLAVATVWLWLSLSLAVPTLIQEGRIIRPDTVRLREIIFFGALGAAYFWTTPLVLYALANGLHLIVSMRRYSWPLSAALAGVLLSIAPIFVAWQRRPPTDANILVKQSAKIADRAITGLTLSDGDWFGSSVALLGDLDADGIKDLAVGASGTDATHIKYRVGAVHILHMNADGSARTTRKITSGKNGGPTLEKASSFGCALAPVGDLNGDGIADLAVGASGDNTGGFERGAVYVLFMSEDGRAKRCQKIASSVGGGPVLADRDSFGRSIASLGDLDGDKVTDLAVSAGDSNHGPYKQAVYILMMRADGTAAKCQKLASGVGGVPELPFVDQLGDALAQMGDLDGDGLTDLAISAADEGSGAWNRVIYLLFMNADGTVKRHRKIAPGVAGGPDVEARDWYGESLALVGDLDGNGVSDLAVGAPRANAGGYQRGTVHLLLLNADATIKRTEVIFGGAGGPELSDEDAFGRSMASLGDFDGDGVMDLIVGAPQDSTGGKNRGAVHLVLLQCQNGAKASGFVEYWRSRGRHQRVDSVVLRTSE